MLSGFMDNQSVRYQHLFLSTMWRPPTTNRFHSGPLHRDQPLLKLRNLDTDPRRGTSTPTLPTESSKRVQGIAVPLETLEMHDPEIGTGIELPAETPETEESLIAMIAMDQETQSTHPHATTKTQSLEILAGIEPALVNEIERKPGHLPEKDVIEADNHVPCVLVEEMVKNVTSAIPPCHMDPDNAMA